MSMVNPTLIELLTLKSVDIQILKDLLICHRELLSGVMPLMSGEQKLNAYRSIAQIDILLSSII